MYDRINFMDGLNEKYDLVLKESIKNENVIGLILGGSRAKSNDFITKHSDLDVYVILSDTAPKELEDALKAYESDGFEIRVYRLVDFATYASWGSHKEWDRYNFSHTTAIVDKTGEIQRLIDKKGKLPNEVQKKVASEAIDDYFNQVYRSAKYWRDGRDLAAYLDATESLPPLMTALYALEERIKPYNKYFEWELKNYPLKLLPWPAEEFIADYKHILQTGDVTTQKKIFNAVKKLFIAQGFDEIVSGWKNYYFVGE